MIFIASDGIRIHCKSFCQKNAHADLLVVHGLGEHMGRYQEFTQHLHAAQVNVHLIDLRGHGCSEGLSGHVENFSQYHQDLDDWIGFLKTNQKISNLPLFILGHSLGGLIVLDFTLHQTQKSAAAFAGIALSAPALGILSLATLLKPVLDLGLTKLIDGLHFPNGINSAYLSHDSQKVKEYNEDPLIHHKITISLFKAMLSAIERVIHTKASLPASALFLIAEDDKIIDPDAILKFAKKVKAVDKDIRTLQGFYHEIFQEKNREEAYTALIQWLRRCSGQMNQKKNAKDSSKSSGKKATAKEVLRSPPESKVISISI